MIQRIQTLWLLLATASGALMFFMPLAYLYSGGAELVLKYSGVYNTATGELHTTAYTITGLIAITVFLSFITIFIYKNRILQMRLCVYTAILMIAVMALTAYYLFYMYSGFKIVPEFIVFLPLIGFILLLMARRAIKRDEELVRAIDRIR
jgi:hypothetical protein